MIMSFRNTILKIVTFIIIFWFSSFTIIAQQNNNYYPNFTSVPGLPTKMANSVFKDSKGFMWFGAENGLYRWDGYEYKAFHYDPNDSTSISGNMISRILMEDDEGNIWIGTQASGLNIYNPNTENFNRFIRNPEYRYDFDYNQVHIALSDKDGDIWLASQTSGGIMNFDKSTGIYTSYWPKKDTPISWANRISSIYEDRTGKLWIGTFKGLYLFDKQTKTFSKPGLILKVPDALMNTTINHIFEDHDGIIWIGSEVGLFKLNITQKIVDHFRYDENDLQSLCSDYIIKLYDNPIDEGKSLGIITNIGLNKLDKSSGIITRFKNDPSDPRSRAFNATFDLLLDDNGMLWAATAFGAIRYNLIPNLFSEYQIGPFKQDPYLYEATTFLEDSKGDFWIGTNYSGLLKYDKKMNLISKYNYDPNNPDGISYYMIFSLFTDSDNVLWIGTANSLDVFDQQNDRFLHCSLPSEINFSYIRPNYIHEDRSGMLWIGASSGIYYQKKQEILDTSFQQVPHFVGSMIEIRSIAEDSLGNIWFGSNGSGLFLLTPENRKTMELINFLHDPNDITSISDNVIWTVYIDDNDALWSGTSNGLNRYDLDNKKFYHFNHENGLDAKFIYFIEGDKRGNLWLSTEKGIMRFNYLNDSTGSSKLLETADGVPFEDNYHFKIYKGKDGKIYIGGRWVSGNGFYSFHPDSLKDNDHIPEIVLTEFLVNYKPFNTDSSITEIKHLNLKHNENFFSVKFAALDFVNPSKNEYAYMLKGFDKNWIYSNNRRLANYTNVPAGDYIFRAKGSNNDGLWNEEGVSLKITISPPPWKTWWAYLFYGIFIATILYFIFRYYFKRQQLLHILALEQVQTEKLEELDRTKSRFFANISHEFRTPLTLILGPMEKLRTQISDGAKKDLDMMLRNARRLQNLINQLLSLSKLESGKIKLQAGEVNIVSLVKRYSQSFESLAKQKKIEFIFNSSETNIPLFVDRDKIEKILYNLLSNAFKFTGEEGRIVVSVTPLEGGRGVNISISDTGRGLPPDQLERIFDRFYQADNNYAKDQEGTGIGLALTKELVELHYGKITAESQMDVGTTFTVFLPMGKEHLKPNDLVESVKQVKSVNWENQQEQFAESYIQETITDDNIENEDSKPLLLIVEDNDDLRSYVRSYLTDNYLITEAIDGEMGLEKAIERIPDLVISDVMMPKMDGIELTERLKEDERTSHIPVILLTAKAAREDKLEGLQTGADDFLTKPFDPQELLIRISNLIGQREKLKEKYKSRFVFAEARESDEPMSSDDKFLRKASHFIEQNLADSDLNVERFAQQMAMSQSQLYRKLKALTDLSPNEMIRSVRLQRAANLLLHHSGNIAEIAYEVGFNNPSYFSECFQKQFGKLPSEYTG